jgi:hypothetical protein
MLRKSWVWGASAVTLCCLLVPVGASAQVTRTFAGVLGGATVGDLGGGGGVLNTNSRWGGTAGVFVGAQNWNYVAFSLEGNWEQKGGGDVRLDYISVPLTVGGVVNTGSDLSARLYGGVGIGFKVGCKSSEFGVDCDRAKGTEWTLPIGFMFGRSTGSGRFVALDVRYVVPLSHPFENLLAYNRSWQFRAVIGLAGSRR